MKNIPIPFIKQKNIVNNFNNIPANPFTRLLADNVSISGLKTRFRIGIEFEGMILTEVFHDFKQALLELSANEDGEYQIQFGTDNSIKNIPEGYQSFEIRTTTLQSRYGILLLEQMLSFLYIASQTNDFITNETCGLHINISECNIFENGNQVSFYYNVVSLFDENGILELFNRTDNKYCLPLICRLDERSVAIAEKAYKEMKKREKRAALEGATTPFKLHESKYLAVSLRDSPKHGGYNGPELVSNRIEFRCIGGKDYHLEFEKLDESINHILGVCRAAYKAVMV